MIARFVSWLFLLVPLWCWGQIPYKADFDCSKLTNDENRAICFNHKKEVSTHNGFSGQVEYKLDFDCLKLTNEQNQITCLNQKIGRSSSQACPENGVKHNCFGGATFANGNKYVGEWRDGKFHGQGTYTFSSGNRYVGEFRDGRYSGRGTFSSSNGDHYVGEFREDRPEGAGEFTWRNGDRYEGTWRNGKKHGHGKMTLASGQTYTGEFRADAPNGTGIETSVSGERYVGEWKDGFKSGEGIEYRGNGTIIRSGTWEQGKLVQLAELDTNRFPFNPPTQIASAPIPASDTAKVESERLASELEAERKKRQELEVRLAAESKERERLALEAKAQERLAQEAKDREKDLAEARERERLLAEAKERDQRSPSPPVQVASPKNPHALIIGNAAYPGSSRLDNPINDAKAIEQKLRSMGFIVTVVTDANRQRLVQAMSQFRKTASNADLSLLFYSGHGVQIFGTNYILPIDVDQSDVAQATIQGVSLNSVVENFLPGKTKIVFLDACRDNPLQRSSDRSVSKGLAPISVAQGTLIAYATKDGQTASDGVGQKNSPFTKALLEHLSDPQDIAVILRKVREKVMTATGGKQQPWEYGSLTGGELVLSGLKK